MIAKLTTGNGFSGAARYDLRIGKKEKPTDPGEVKVLGLEGNLNHNIDENSNINVDVRQLSRDFRFQAMMRPSVRKPVYHWALSWKKGEHLPDEEMLKAAKEFMQAIGFNNTQYIVVRHKKDNEHCHVLANIVDFNGDRILTEDLIPRAHYAAKMITKLNGYAWGKNAREETIKNAHKPHEKVRYIIEPIVRDAVAEAKDIDLLPGLLDPYGIACRIKRSNEGKVVGISFGYEMDGQRHTFRGSDLDRSLSAGNIVKEIVRRQEAEKAAREAQEAAEKAAAEAARKANAAIDREYNDYVAGYRSVVYPVNKQIYDLRKSSYELYKAVKDSDIGISAATSSIYIQLDKTGDQIDKYNRQLDDAKDRLTVIKGICGLLTCMNPIVGLTAMFLAGIAGDIHEALIIAKKHKTYEKVETLYGQLRNLEAEKTAITTEKRDRLQSYLDAKRMYEDYQNAMQAVKHEIAAIKNDIQSEAKRDIIRNYVASPKSKILIDYINNAFPSTYDHEHLVPGELAETEHGMRWRLYSDGHSNSGVRNMVILYQHKATPQGYGESYIDFSFNEKGELQAVIEADPLDKYKSGITGKLNMRTREGQITVRNHRGSLKEHQAQMQRIRGNFQKYTSSDNKSQQKKSKGPKPH